MCLQMLCSTFQRMQRNLILSPESDGSDAINDDEASSDEKVGELNDSTGADKIEN